MTKMINKKEKRNGQEHNADNMLSINIGKYKIGSCNRFVTIYRY